ncbi:hypothetical protein TNCV_4103941, partial [Trichonephila clavipes]
MVAESRQSLTIGKACLERILSPRPVSREWDNRTQEGREILFVASPKKKGRGTCSGPTPGVENGFFQETREEPCPGSRELEKREREKSPEGRRTDIGVKRKE